MFLRKTVKNFIPTNLAPGSVGVISFETVLFNILIKLPDRLRRFN